MSLPARASETPRASPGPLNPQTAPHTVRGVGLRYVSDSVPGIRRERQGDGFVYRSANGRRITESAELARIKHLAVPPAWTDVWVCPSATGHIQATGRDARGRKQYRYHEAWRRMRDETKYHRMLDFAAALPRIRARVEADLRARSISRDRVLASVVRFLDLTSLRVGNRVYARDNGSFGLTTLRSRHVRVRADTLHVEFRGKSGREHSITVRDGRLAAIVRHCQELPGQELFQYLDGEGGRHRVDSEDVNDYIREAAGDDFTAKDFRTWTGTVLAAWSLRDGEPARSDAELKRGLVQAVAETARRLGNTAAVCRRCYIHPEVISAHLDGALVRGMKGSRSARSRGAGTGLTPDEAAVIALLRRRQARRRSTGRQPPRPESPRGPRPKPWNRPGARGDRDRARSPRRMLQGDRASAPPRGAGTRSGQLAGV